MTTINLYQNQAEKESKVSVASTNSGLFISIGIIVLTLLVLVGFKVYVPMMQKANDDLIANIAMEKMNLTKLKDLEKIVDIQKRTDEIQKNLKIVDGKVTKTEMIDVIGLVAKEMIPKVVVSSFVYDKGKISLLLNAPNFNDASRQIASFRDVNSNFTDVKLTKISRAESIVEFGMDMSVKPVSGK